MENENKQIQGWRDVNIVADMPLNAIVSFLNVLNQRLCAIEDHTFISVGENEEMSLTEFYAKQAAEDMAAMQNNTEGE